jgi:hypothetical protein
MRRGKQACECRQVSARRDVRRLPLAIVLMSGHDPDEVRERLGDVPVLAVLAKPFELRQLRILVETVCDPVA